MGVYTSILVRFTCGTKVMNERFTCVAIFAYTWRRFAACTRSVHVWRSKRQKVLSRVSGIRASRDTRVCSTPDRSGKGAPREGRNDELRRKKSFLRESTASL